MNTVPEQGWYPNPENPSQVRWWDGNAWTDHVERNPMAAPAVAQISDGSVPPPPLAPSSQDSERSFSGWLNELFGLVWSRIGHLFTLAVLFALIPSLLQTAAMYLVLRDTEVRIDYLTDEITYSGAGAAGFVFLAFTILITIAAAFVLFITLCRQIHLVSVDKPESWSDSIRPALRRSPRYLWVQVLAWSAAGILFVVVTAVIVGTALISPVFLVLTIPMATVLLIITMIRFSFTNVIAAIGPRGYPSLRSSFALTKGRMMTIFGRMAFLFIITTIVSLIVSSAAQTSALSFPAGSGITEDVVLNFETFYGTNPATFVLGTVLSSFVSTISLALMLAGLLVMYKDFDGEIAEELQ